MRLNKHFWMIAFILLLSRSVFAQDAGAVLRLSVGYRTVKNTAKLSPEKQKEVEALEALARAANNNQKYGEAYKHYSHAIALIRNQEWTPLRALGTSLQWKADRAVFDPRDAARLSLTQFFMPDQPVEGTLTAQIEIKNDKQGVAQTLQTTNNLSPDFSKGFQAEVPIPDLPDGEYQMVLSLKPKEGEPIVKQISVRIARGLTADSRALAKRIDEVRANLKEKGDEALLPQLPGIEYAASMVDLVNKGQIAGSIDIRAALTEAEKNLAMIQKGESPLRSRRGDIRWAYRSKVDDTLQPFRFFIPSAYDASRRWPLVVALHGMGGDENSFFNAYDNGILKRLAESRGYLVVCPKGRQPTSMYFGPAEKDVLDVLGEMKREFAIDEDRVYLMGHSMGGYGSWSVSVNNPDLFAAIGPFAGGGTPLVTGRLKAIAHIPWFVVHGDADPTVPVEESRKMVKMGQDLGIKIKYVEVPGGDHTNIVVPKMSELFDWFDAHKRQPKSAVKAAGSGQ
jgi:predicted esterase